MRPVKKHKAGKLRFRFSLLVDEKDEIIGFSIKGCGNITSRIFCGSFLQAMENGDVSIKLSYILLRILINLKRHLS